MLWSWRRLEPSGKGTMKAGHQGQLCGAACRELQNILNSVKYRVPGEAELF